MTGQRSSHGPRLPKMQRAQLALLGARNSRTRENGTSVYEGASPGSMGALINKGLAEKAVKREHGSQRTIYWLTDEGFAEYQLEQQRGAKQR